MPYLILLIGILIGIYGLYRFVINAEIEQIKALFIAIFLGGVGLAAFILAMTGRLGAAIAVGVALTPVIAGFFKHKTKQRFNSKNTQNPSPYRPGEMTRKEALAIMGLDETADDKTIKETYKMLVKKLHPDQQGSAWMTAKLNEARDMLLNKDHKA